MYNLMDCTFLDNKVSYKNKFFLYSSLTKCFKMVSEPQSSFTQRSCLSMSFAGCKHPSDDSEYAKIYQIIEITGTQV